MKPLALFGCVALVLLGNVKGADPIPAAKEIDLSDLPALEEFKIDPYLAAAATLQAMKKEKATVRLAELATRGNHRGTEQAVILCRMLFVCKTNGEFRRPGLGGPGFVGPTSFSDWPLEPIEIVDGVPFCVVTGYLVTGHPEPAIKYLKYCVDNCDWNPEVFKPKTAEEKQRAMAKLVTSPRWRGPITEEGKKMLAAQLK